MFTDKNLRKNELKKLEETIENTILNKRGCILMPAFSLDLYRKFTYKFKANFRQQ